MSKELPFFKFNVSEWLTGSISYEPYDIQGVFIRVCALYWNRGCQLTLHQAIKMTGSDLIENLVAGGYISHEGANISIDFLDEEYKDITARKSKLSEAGRKGGLKSAKARLKGGSSNKDIDIDIDIDIDKEVYKGANHLTISTQEFSKLADEYGAAKADEYVDKVLNYANNHKYKSLYLTALTWLRKDAKDEANKPKTYEKPKTTFI